MLSKAKRLWFASFFVFYGLPYRLCPGLVVDALLPPQSHVPIQRRTQSLRRQQQDANDQVADTGKQKASKRGMMSFALPALGIYLSNPLLSNIDNAFIGRTVGTAGLAALSPATVCTDQMLYLFSFLSRATTSLVSRSYAAADDGANGDYEAARTAASAPLSVSLICGTFLIAFYAFCTPGMLQVFNVNPSLRPSASAYIYWRGAIAPAALAQAACLSVLMATRDAITPLKIIGIAAILNVVGDYVLCVGLGWGCAGAAAATSGATLISCGFMLRSLKKKNLLPQVRLPTKQELANLTEFMGPLLAITLTRLGGFISMQRAAMKLGVQQLAAYQICVNALIFFLLFGEPLSQLSQTQLPALIDRGKGSAVRATLKSVLTLAAFTSLGIGVVALASLYFGAGGISSDLAVQALAQKTAPSVFLAVVVTIFAVAVDGAMLASRDFGFMLGVGMASFLMQIYLLTNHCQSLAFIFGTFTFRLGSYAVLAMLRIALGKGALGRALRLKSSTSN